MDAKKISVYAGLTVVIGTHIAMVMDAIPMTTKKDKQIHAVANLVASGLIIYGIL
jgi:hypothetical protein